MDSAEEDFLIKFGEHLRKVREEKGLSSAEVARRCFMDRGNYTRIETGNTNARLTTLKKVCEAMEIDFEKLFKGFKG